MEYAEKYIFYIMHVAVSGLMKGECTTHMHLKLGPSPLRRVRDGEKNERDSQVNENHPINKTPKHLNSNFSQAIILMYG